MRFCPYSAYHILFKMQGRRMKKQRWENRCDGGKRRKAGRKKSNQRGKEVKKERNMTDLHKKGVYK